MTKAAIEASLVSIKNVSTHKSVTLTLHVPEEYAMKAIEAFGWPTMANPVSVAVARLDLSVKEERKGGKLARQAGILSGEPAFHMFLKVQHSVDATLAAAQAIREKCDVHSRIDLDYDEIAAAKFHELKRTFEAWKSL